MTDIKVTTHVGRDLIQSANIFKTAEVAVWEYIVNSIQYISPGTSPTVTVDVNNKNKIKPLTSKDLKEIHGIGKEKVKSFGNDIVKVVIKHNN